MRAPRRCRLIAAGLQWTALFLFSSGCPDKAPPASGSTTFPAQIPAVPEELPDTPAPLEELGSSTQPDPVTQEVTFNAPEDTGLATQGDDWTSFRNGLQLRGIAGSELPEDPQLLWDIPTVHGSRSTPAILDGRVYIGTLDGYVFCLNLRTGEQIWSYRTIESTDPEEFAPGFNAPTTVSEDAVFIGDDDGTLHAINRETGEQLWAFETQGEIVGGATLLPGDRVMFGSHDGRLYCLSTDSGEVIWQFEALGPVNGTQAVTADDDDETETPAVGGVNGSLPVVGSVTFVTGCDKPTLRAVNIDSGEQVMEIPLGDALLIASPALVGTMLYFGTDSGEVIALDWKQQATEWIYSDPDDRSQIHSSPAVTDDVVIIGSRDKRVHCIERDTGERRWAFETRGMIDCSPVVVGNRVFFGSADRYLYAVNIDDGSEAWKYQVGQRINGSPAIGEGCLVIAAEDRQGRIYCFGTP